MNDFQNMIDNPKPRDIEDKYSEPLENFLLMCFGKQGRVSWYILKDYARLVREYEVKPVYDILEYMGKNGKFGIAYLESALKKKAEKQKQYEQRSKQLAVTKEKEIEVPTRGETHKWAMEEFKRQLSNPDPEETIEYKPKEKTSERLRKELGLGKSYED